MKKRINKSTLNTLFDIMSFVINGTTPISVSSEIDIGELYSLAKYHKVANILCYGLSDFSDEQKAPFKAEKNKAMGRAILQQTEFDQITALFEQKGIPYMPVKGLMLRDLYPSFDMRFMLDNDIYVSSEYHTSVSEIMLERGYEIHENYTDKDISFIKKPLFNFEIHNDLIDEKAVGHELFDDLEKIIKPQDGNEYRYVLSHEDFYLYLLVHLHRHYICEGTGIRSICDIYLYRKKFHDMNYEYINGYLKNFGIFGFAQKVHKLADDWFETPKTREFDDFAMFFISNGILGRPENFAMDKIISDNGGKNTKTARLKYFIRVIFPDIKVMTEVYPSLRKVPFLLPFYWIFRIFHRALFKREAVKSQYTSFKNTSPERIKKMQDMRKNDNQE